MVDLFDRLSLHSSFLMGPLARVAPVHFLALFIIYERMVFMNG